MKISGISPLNYNFKPTFQRKLSMNETDSFTLNNKNSDEIKQIKAQPIIKRVYGNKVILQADSLDKEVASKGIAPSRIIAGCKINELSGFEGCEAVIITSAMNTVTNFKKAVISAKSLVKNIKNTMFCGLEKGKAENIEADTTLITSNSQAGKIQSYATGVMGNDINVKDIKTNILNTSGESSPDDIFIEKANVCETNFKFPDIDLLDNAIMQTHNFKNDGHASISNCTIKELTCSSLNALNAKLGTVNMTSNKTSVLSNSEIDNYITSESDIILTDTHIKKLTIPGKNKKVYISVDDNSQIDDFKFDDKSSYVIINNFPKKQTIYISKSNK